MKKIILSLLVIITIIAFIGCDNAPSNKYTFTSENKMNVLNFITYSNNIVPSQFMKLNDMNYAIPQLDWIKKEFTPFYASFLFKNNLRIYRDPLNNCNKFTVHARSNAHILYDKTPRKIDTASLAVGEYSYWEGFTLHVINIFIARNEFGEMIMVYYEPQIQDIIPFNPKDDKCVELIL